jgi:hypothetical protein
MLISLWVSFDCFDQFNDACSDLQQMRKTEIKQAEKDVFISEPHTMKPVYTARLVYVTQKSAETYDEMPGYKYCTMVQYLLPGNSTKKA